MVSFVKPQFLVTTFCYFSSNSFLRKVQKKAFSLFVTTKLGGARTNICIKIQWSVTIKKH